MVEVCLGSAGDSTLPVAPARFRFAVACLLLVGACALIGFTLPVVQEVEGEVAIAATGLGVAGLALASFRRRKQPPVALTLGLAALLAIKPLVVPIDCTLIEPGWCDHSSAQHLSYWGAAGLCVLLAASMPLASLWWRRRARRRLAPGERIIEMTWRCTSCKHVNLGRHLVCQGCGNPMDGSEQYEMPADTSKAASVTRADLLVMALAGPNWRCAYCGGDQREADGRCRNCGATAPKQLVASQVHAWSPRAITIAGLCCAAALVAGTIASAATRAEPRFRDSEVRLEALRWSREVSVFGRVAVEGQGFAEAQPAEAFDVIEAGAREHHQETVCDEVGSESYTEEVPDGTRTERYTERVACGRTCTSSSRRCREECTGTGTGFAKCKTVCSGGGETCTTKYCNETRTRAVPKTRSVKRLRSVCKRSHLEPRSAPWFTWKTWRLQTVRTLRREGTSDDPMVWPPDAEVAHDAATEKLSRSERCTAVFRDGAATVELHLPASRWAALKPGAQYQLRRWTGLIGNEEEPVLLDDAGGR